MGDKITYGMIGLLSLLVLVLGGDQYLSESQLDHAYICSVTKEVGIFDRLSSTSKTGYWTDNEVQKSKTCTNGLWLNLKQYAKDNNIQLNVLLNQESILTPSSQVNGLQYLCNIEKCVVK